MAVGDAYVFHGFLTPVLTQLFFRKPPTTFLTAEVRCENTPERKVASTGDRTHNHQVMSPTRSPLSHPGGPVVERHPITREIRDLLRPRSTPKGNTVYFYMSSSFIYTLKIHSRSFKHSVR